MYQKRGNFSRGNSGSSSNSFRGPRNSSARTNGGGSVATSSRPEGSRSTTSRTFGSRPGSSTSNRTSGSRPSGASNSNSRFGGGSNSNSRFGGGSSSSSRPSGASNSNSRFGGGSSSNSRFGGSSSSRPNRFGGSSNGRSRFGGNSRGRRSTSSNLDISRFVNKALAEAHLEVFVPEHKFSDFQIHDTLKQAIAERGFEIPTPIQDKTIPLSLENKDVVGIANTGTGKTGAFLVPLLNKIISNKTEKVLIMVPTRELAIQIDEELRAFTKSLRINSVVCVGGMNIFPQISKLRGHYNFVIGTPGRLNDLIQRKRINLKEFKSVVLDEADRMLDMGFIADMRFIMSLMPAERQTLFFSATLSPEIKKLIGEFLKDPISVSVSTRDTSQNIDQDIVPINRGEDKIEILHNLLIKEGFDKVLVFGKTKIGVEKLSQELIKKGFKADSIHGDKNHGRRQRALQGFKNNNITILVATDVAARGLDIPNVSHVINYDLPENHDDYIHRIGRTGRGNNKGTALTFVDHFKIKRK